MPRTLGKREAAVFAYAQMRGMVTVRTGDLVRPLEITAQQERELLSRAARKNLLVRVRRGLYLVPPRLPLGGRWSPSEAQALNALMDDQHGRYQLCGPNAFSRYGFDQQIPARLYVYNNRLSGERKIGAVVITLIKVADDRLGDVEQITMPDGLTLVYSSRTRTLMDAVYDWSRFNSLPRGYAWIEQDLDAERVRPADLVATTVCYGNQGTIRRIGVLLERLGAPERTLKKLERTLRSSSSLIPFVPNRPKRGAISRRWGVILNDQA